MPVRSAFASWLLPALDFYITVRIMPLQILATHAQLVSAINSFSSAYHADYFRVRALGRSYLSAPASMATVVPLATALQDVLSRWGAGTRKAPCQQPINRCQAVLMNPHLHARLNLIAATPISLAGGITRIITGVHDIAALRVFDSSLIDTLNALASGLFVNNTNVTYPMKALLLITGFMPAFDSQVRKGLALSELAGFGKQKTQMLLPQNATKADGMKITRFPFYIADCHTRNAGLINDAVLASHYPGLVGEVGRIFDVLLFVQATIPVPMMALNPVNRNWHRIA